MKKLLPGGQLAPIVIIIMLLTLGNRIYSQTNTWTGATSTSWTTTSNWSLGHAPTSAETVVIGNFVPGSQPTLSGSTTIANLSITGRSGTTSTRGGDLTIATGITLTITGNLTMTGASGGGTFSGTRITCAGTASISVGGSVTTTNGSTAGEDPQLVLTSGTLTVTGSFSLSTNTVFTAGTSTVIFNGSSGTQTLTDGTGDNFNNISKTAASTVLLASNVPVAGNLSISAGIFDLSSFTANRTAAGGVLTVSDGATLRIGGTNSFPTNYSTRTLGTNSTIEYSGTGQAISNQSYGKLILSGSGNKTFATSTTIAGNLSISGTAVALLSNGTTSTANTLTLAGAGQPAGSWGGTGSLATNKNATFFGSSTTGILNVTQAACAQPTITGNSTICGAALTTQLTGSGTPASPIAWASSNTSVATVSNSGLVTAVSPGATVITYTINTGCNNTVTVNVFAIPVASVSNQSNITCNGSNNGTITLSASGGTSPGNTPFTYSVDNGGSFQSSPLFQNLLPNHPYRVKVKDGHGCISK